MVIKKNFGYVVEGSSYLCIGFNEKKDRAILSPFYSEDEDEAPQLHIEDGFIILQNPIPSERLEEIQEFTGVLEFA